MLDRIYPDLYQFLASYFPDADLEGLTDDDVAKEFGRTADPELRGKVLSQGGELLSNRDIPWQMISELVNRDFSDEVDCREWLTRLLQRVERCHW